MGSSPPTLSERKQLPVALKTHCKQGHVLSETRVVRYDRSSCGVCNSARVAKWHKAHPERRRATIKKHGHKYFLKAKYGITPERYCEMFEAQGGVCAICKRCERRRTSSTRLAVDHDHETGRVRGLLCTTCNTAIGMLDDNLDLVTALFAYLEGHQRKPNSSGNTLESVS